MDPITALTLAGTITTLVVKTGSVIKTLSDLQQKYKDAALSIQSTIMACQTLNAALTGMQSWLSRPNQVQSHPLKLQMAASASHVKLVMAALDREIGNAATSGGKFGWRKKTKIVWKAETFRGYEVCIQQQCVALNLLLNVFQLQTPEEQVEALSTAHVVFEDAMDSASTIVPENENPFEDELQTSPVYRRAFFSNLITAPDVPVTATPVSNPPLSNEGYEELPVHLTTFAKIMSSGFHLTAFASERLFNIPAEVRQARAKLSEEDKKNGKLNSKLISEIMASDGTPHRILKLLDKGAKLQIPLFISNANGLMAPKSTLLQLLLIFGETDVNQPTAYLLPGWTLLHEAALRDGQDIVAKLLSRGVAPCCKDEESNTPLSVAIREGNLSIADRILAAVKNREIQETDDPAPSLDANTGWSLGSLNLRTADLERKHKQGLTCFLMAVREKRYDLAELLLAAGSDPDVKDIKGRSALFYLPDMPSTRSIQIGHLLIKHGANIHTRDKEGRTAFLKAITRGDYELVKFFLSAGSDIDVQHKNLPAIYYASILESSTILRLLLERRADVDAHCGISDNDGPAAIALRNLIDHVLKRPGSGPVPKGRFPDVENIRILWDATTNKSDRSIRSITEHAASLCTVHVSDGRRKLLNILARISIVNNETLKLDDLAWAVLKPIIEREKSRLFFNKPWPQGKPVFWENANWSTIDLKRKRIHQIATWDDDT